MQASLGGTARFQCVIKSVPKTRITDIVWYKNDQPLQDSSGRYYELPDGVLVIRNIGNQDRGTYACEARSKILDKEIISQKASLMVRSSKSCI